MSKLTKIFRRRERAPEDDIRLYQLRQEALGLVGNALIPDEIPMAPPIGYVKQPSMVEIIRDQIRNHTLQHELDRAGYETFEESDDFDVGDPDDLPRSIYEMEEVFDPLIRAKEGRFTEDKPAKVMPESKPESLQKSEPEPIVTPSE